MHRLRRAKLLIGSAFSLALLVMGAHLIILQVIGNFHEVIAGELYRSAQPSSDDIRQYVASHGIKTIVNLRGENKGSVWYDNEIAQARKMGVGHIDFRMSAWRRLPQSEAAELISILATAEKPILIHCNSGADRSGLAAALYVAAVAKGGEQAAERQISFRYGHIAIPIIAPFAMDETFELLELWLGYPNS